MRPAQPVRRDDRDARGFAASLHGTEHPVTLHFPEQPVIRLLPFSQIGQEHPGELQRALAGFGLGLGDVEQRSMPV